MLDFLAVLARRWRIVTLFVLVGVAAATAVTSQMTPQYRAGSQLFVALATTDSVSDLTQSQLFSAHRVKSYPDLVVSPLVLEPVIADLGLDDSVSELAERVSAQVPPNTVLIEVTAVDLAPARAADIANAVSAQLSEVISDLDRTSPGAASPVRVSQVRPAEPPAMPFSPIPLLNLALGLLAGLGLGLAAAALRDALDNSIKTEQDVEDATGLPTLTAVPANPDIAKAPLIDQSNSNPVWSESYRRLRTNVSFLDPDNPPRVLLFTSALPGDGKTATAANLTLALAQSGRTALLIEADLRRPSLGRLLGLVSDVGVTTVVAGQASLTDVTQSGNGFDTVTSGPVPPNPSEILGSQAFQNLVEEGLRRYDHVVIDTPPLMAVTDAAVASAAADAVIVVTKARRTTKAELTRAIDRLRAVDAHVVGVVLNQVRAVPGGYYEYEYAASSDAKSTRRERKQKQRA